MERPNAQPIFEIVDRVAPELIARAAAHDAGNTFVADGYALLKDAGFFGAGVPVDLGGGDASHGELCEALRRLGHACPATALAAAMHSHLVAAAVWRYRHGKGGDALLRRVATEGLVLVSTGAGDWLESNGQLTRDGEGYRLNARKIFASGSPAGDMLVTSAVYADPVEGEQVLHFAVPMRAPGVTVAQDWDTLGMRGTGSHTVHLENAFVPDASIVLKRPRKGWHPVWAIVLTVAAPLYMAPYLGVAEAARDRALEHARKVRDREEIPLLVGEMDNALAMARLAFGDLVANAASYDFAPELDKATRALTGKTLLAEATIRTVEKAMEVVGGASYFRSTGIERLFRDVQGGTHHPLPEKRQQRLTGRVALGLDPV
jgi:alkylation response protein AidB-like acyl-CoA dehydrogenase